ncbi:uncharacterized protein [Struthio camelus]|uniref:uncharacterized protein isoform X9 n=1 Tax=Struthio camelus TaxID=8801 RepID=UPI0036042BCE
MSEFGRDVFQVGSHEASGLPVPRRSLARCVAEVSVASCSLTVGTGVGCSCGTEEPSAEMEAEQVLWGASSWMAEDLRCCGCPSAGQDV